MFRLDRFQRIAHGKYQVVLTLHDPTLLPMLRFLRGVSAFTERLNRRIDHERRVLELTDARAASAPAAAVERARILALYRTLPGARALRLKLLRSVLKDQYPRIGYDDVRAVISLGVADERAFRRARAAQLSCGGLSCREIAKRLGISPAQASRLSSPAKGDSPGCPTIDDLPSGAQGRARFPRSLTAGGAAAAG